MAKTDETEQLESEILTNTDRIEIRGAQMDSHQDVEIIDKIEKPKLEGQDFTKKPNPRIPKNFVMMLSEFNSV